MRTETGLPTITCESNRSFTCLNTYDSAAITLGHGQFAAHTPDDNFVAIFREALGHDAAAEYFPVLHCGHSRAPRRRGR
jgi:hypothetical protein